jgi:hypothetical protein
LNDKEKFSEPGDRNKYEASLRRTLVLMKQYAALRKKACKENNSHEQISL